MNSIHPDEMYVVRASRFSRILQLLVGGKRSHILCAVAMFACSACSERPPSYVSIVPGDSGLSDAGIGIPAELLASRMINLDTLILEVRIADTVVQMDRSGNQWTGLISLPPGTDRAVLSIIWFMLVEDQLLPLAAAEPLEITAESLRDILVTNYNYSQFDSDTDGVSNLNEIDAGTDPLVADMSADQTEPDETEPDETEPDETEPDETEPDETPFTRLQVQIRLAASNEVIHSFSSDPVVEVSNGRYLFEVMSELPVARMRVLAINDECDIGDQPDVVNNNSDDPSTPDDDNPAERFLLGSFILSGENVTCLFRFNSWYENFQWAGGMPVVVTFK